MKLFLRITRILLRSLKKPKELEVVLPFVFNEIDKQIPGMIGTATGQQIEELITRAIEKATGGAVTDDQVKTVIRLYSPVEAANKTFGG